MTVLPSSLTRNEPFCTRKALSRSRSGLTDSPATVGVVSFLATDASWSQLVGMSASVRPAAVHRSVLMNSASVDMSFGAQ